MARGHFITFEGLDGSGKTTQLRRLAEWLSAAGQRVVTLRQPGSTPLGDRLRAVLLDSRSERSLGRLDPMAEMALMFADRAQAIADVIEPALHEGAIVLCDRFTDSTEAYQGAGRELGSTRVLELHRVICNGLQPDLTILLLPSLESSLLRARRRNQKSVQRDGKDENRFEREPDEFYARIHHAYQEIATREPRRVVKVGDEAEDSSIEGVERLIRQLVCERIPTLRES